MKSTKKMIIAAVTSLAIVSSGVVLCAKNMGNAPSVTAKQAIDIALTAIPGVVHEVELEKENDTLAWEIELVAVQDDKEYEILIDANTGKVIKQELDGEHGKCGFFSVFDNEGDRRHR